MGQAASEKPASSRQARKTAIALALIAAGMYFGFILATGLKG